MSSLQEKIDALDLTDVKAKFIKTQSWWSKLWVKADAVEQEYRRFLRLCGSTNERVSPWCKELDEFWHTHILHTKKYGEDCQYVFGHMLHHTPFTKVDIVKAKINDVTHQLYRDIFQESAKKFGLVACFGGSCSGGGGGGNCGRSASRVKFAAGCDACSSGGGCTSCCSGGCGK